MQSLWLYNLVYWRALFYCAQCVTIKNAEFNTELHPKEEVPHSLPSNPPPPFATFWGGSTGTHFCQWRVHPLEHITGPRRLQDHAQSAVVSSKASLSVSLVKTPAPWCKTHWLRWGHHWIFFLLFKLQKRKKNRRFVAMHSYSSFNRFTSIVYYVKI